MGIKRYVSYALASASLLLLSACNTNNINQADSSTVTGKAEVQNMVRHINLTATNDILLNPGMGWILLDTALPSMNDCGTSGDYPLVNNIGIMTTWGNLEPQEGIYDFELVDKTIDYWTSHGKRISFRMSTDDFPYYGNRLIGCPEWLYSLGADYQDFMYEPEQIPLKYPDLNNEIYQEYLLKFLEVFGERYGNNPYVDVVGLRGYGLWGEWHSGYKFSNWEERISGLSSVIDIWVKGFQGKKHLSLNYSHEWLSNTLDNKRPETFEEFMRYSALDYALNFEEISFEREGAYGAIEPFEWTFNDMTFDDGKLQIAEIAGGYRELKERQSEDGIDHAKAALMECFKLRPNYITLFGWDKQGSAKLFYEERIDLIQFGLLNMGYRLYPETTEVASAGEPGEIINIKQTWVNTALGRCFENAKIKISLLGKDGTEAAAAYGDGVDLSTIIKNSPLNIEISLQLPEIEGTYGIGVSLVNEDDEAFIALPLEGEENLLYVIGQISVN